MKTGVKTGKSSELYSFVKDLYQRGLSNHEVAEKVNESGLIVEGYLWNDKKSSEYKIHVLGIRTNKRRVSKAKKSISKLDVATDILSSNLDDRSKDMMLKYIYSNAGF